MCGQLAMSYAASTRLALRPERQPRCTTVWPVDIHDQLLNSVQIQKRLPVPAIAQTPCWSSAISRSRNDAGLPAGTSGQTPGARDPDSTALRFEREQSPRRDRLFALVSTQRRIPALSWAA